MWCIVRSARSRALPVITSVNSAPGYPSRKISHETLGLLRLKGPPSSTRSVSQFATHSSPEFNPPPGDLVSGTSWHDSISVGQTGALEIDALPDQSSIVTTVSSLQDLGLGSYASPIGILQNVLDTLHSAGLPWWAAIATTTVALRALTFPVYLRTQRALPEYMVKMSALQKFQAEFEEIRRTGTAREIQKKGDEGMTLTREISRTGMNIYLPSLVQGVVFLSFFGALNGMVKAPVASMQQGGALWFLDLTVADPYYLLPAMTCAALVVILEIGAEVPMRADQSPVIKNIFRFMPVPIFFFIMNFPAATLSYWFTTNLISICQAAILKMPKVREKLNLPPRHAMRVQSHDFMKGTQKK